MVIWLRGTQKDPFKGKFLSGKKNQGTVGRSRRVKSRVCKNGRGNHLRMGREKAATVERGCNAQHAGEKSQSVESST